MCKYYDRLYVRKLLYNTLPFDNPNSFENQDLSDTIKLDDFLNKSNNSL